MLKIASWVLPRPVLFAIAFFLPKYNRQLDPVELKEAIARTLPAGTRKEQVVEFVRSKPALFCDDLGSRVEARLLGEALDRLHMLEIELTFNFDAEQRLLCHSMGTCLKFY